MSAKNNITAVSATGDESGGVAIQRTVFPDRLDLADLYYRARGEALGDNVDFARSERTSVVVPQGVTLSFDTYFNSFFEAYWHQYTTVARLAWRARLSGRGVVTIWRVPEEGRAAIVARHAFDGELEDVEIELPAARAHPCELGLLYFEIAAQSAQAVVHRADWVALDASPRPVRLVAGYCTFDREAFLTNNLRTIADDPGAADCLAAVVVVDQGTRKVSKYPGFAELLDSRALSMRVVEQENLGGSGGFTRCILEALRTDGATHVLLMDDDAVVEPESIRRAAMFLAFAKSEMAVGGAMLNLLRPNEVYEQGSSVVPHRLSIRSAVCHLGVDQRKNVESLREVVHQHYNAWWLMAVPLAVVRRVGLPMPFFIKWDDVEFGCRMARADVPTVSLPGLAVWHVPFCMKKRGWDYYYNVRNALACTALHFDGVAPVVRQILFPMKVVNRLLKLDYFSAWQACEGAVDYLRGPSVLEDDGRVRQPALLAKGRELAVGSLPKAGCLLRARVDPCPRSQLRQALALAAAGLRQLLRPSPAADAVPTCVLPESSEDWYGLRKADVVAIDDRYATRYVVLRRNRALFVRLLARALWITARLIFSRRRVSRRWRAAAAYYTSERFWKRHVGLPDDAPPAPPHFETNTAQAAAGATSNDWKSAELSRASAP